MQALRISIEGSTGTVASAVFGPQGGTLGRAENNTLVLSDAERSVSRLHARVEQRDGGFVLVNMGLNPVIHNGALLSTADEAVLSAGDALRIGRFTLLTEAADADALAADDEKDALFDDMTGQPLPRAPAWPDIALFDDSSAGSVADATRVIRRGRAAGGDSAWLAGLLGGMGCAMPNLPGPVTPEQAGQMMRSAIEDTLRTWIPHCSPAVQQAWFTTFEEALERVSQANEVVRQR